MTTKKSPAKKTVKKAVEKVAKAPRAMRARKEPHEVSVVPVYNAQGKEIGSHQLDKELFDGQIHKGAIYHAIRMYHANRRSGHASTKTRGDVSGGGKKPWRQKGTGRARAGSSRSPLWRGGGKIFGPHPRDYYYTIPQKVAQKALLASLNAKLVQGQVIGIDAITIPEPKTKHFVKIVDALTLTDKKALFVTDKIDETVKKASRNIALVSMIHYNHFSTLDVLSHDTLVFSKAALEKLPERFGSIA